MQGKSLSRVQSFALELLLVGKERVKARELVESFKLALVAHDPGTWIKQMFPDWIADTEEAGDQPQVEYIQEVKDEDLMDTEGEWRFEKRISPEEAERVLAEMSRNPQGSFGVDEMDDDEGWI